MKNLIGNCCAASFIMTDKDKCNHALVNPFAYCLMDFDSINYLIENYESINFHNYELIRKNSWKFSIIIDNKVKIFYPHYKFNPQISYYHNKINHDIESNKIWEYIVKKYEERLNRMENQKMEPIFILGSAGNGRNHYTETQILKLLYSSSKYKIIIAQKENVKFSKTENREYIKIPNNIITDGKPLANYIFENSEILK